MSNFVKQPAMRTSAAWTQSRSCASAIISPEWGHSQVRSCVVSLSGNRVMCGVTQSEGRVLLMICLHVCFHRSF